MSWTEIFYMRFLKNYGGGPVGIETHPYFWEKTEEL